QTPTRVCEAAGLSSVVNFDERIYEASAPRLFKIVSQFEARLSAVMMVGHNPGFEELLAALTGDARRLPTAALACIEFDIEQWSDVAAGEGRLAWLIKPKSLS